MMFWIEGGRLNTSLTSGAAASALFLLGILIALAYVVGTTVGKKAGFETGFAEGRDWYQAQVDDEIAQARSGPPSPGLTEGLAGSAAPPVPPADLQAAMSAGADDVQQKPSPAWVRGNNYVVVQGFKPDALEDARTVRDYLAQSGVEAVIIRRSNGSYQVITVQGFNLQDSTQAELAKRFMERIRQIGARFRAAKGRYDFHDCYLMKLTRDSW